mmetsp:Transcript_115904/g.201209  ORF Transcript_115904/g.201209 Transcript_115904/m.201209 type:complete len:733 (-) Transcript_115904:280-2478(-)
MCRDAAVSSSTPSCQMQGNPSEKSSFMRRGRLRVEELVGAGLELLHCEGGYLVEEVEDYPGQPHLCPRDIIIAIGTSLLCGLSLEEIEDCFGGAFHDGASILCISEADLMSLSLQEIKENAHAALRADVCKATHLCPASIAPYSAQNGKSHIDECQANSKGLNSDALSEAGCLAPEDADKGVEVWEDRCRVICNNGNAKEWLGVRGCAGVLHGLYQFEVEVVGRSLLRVGVGTGAARRAVGKDGRSFGYGGTAMKSTGGKFEEYGEKFEAVSGAVVTCLVDRRDSEQQTISFCLNGKNQGLAFQIPENMADLPLFPMVCGRGGWQAVCHFRNLKYPSPAYQLWSDALQAGDAVSKKEREYQLPQGLSSREASAVVKAGHWVGLYVVDGSWEGWHRCEVLDVDALGCYLRHEEDDFTETIPWTFLNGRYRMQIISHCQMDSSNQNPVSRLDVVRSSCSTIKDALCKLADSLPEDVQNFIDTCLSLRQQTLIMWLASSGFDEEEFMLSASDAGLASSEALQEWLQALQLSAHSDIIKAWCEQQGAVCLLEIVQSRDELVSALRGSLSPTEVSRLQSTSAAEEAEVLYFRSLKSELVSLLSLIMKSLDAVILQSIKNQCSFSRDEWTIIEAAVPSGVQLVGCIPSEVQHAEKPTSRFNKIGVMTSSAERISRRDQKLLQLAAATSIDTQCCPERKQCKSCGSLCKQPDSEGFSEDDGYFYCEACWMNWLHDQPSC